MSQETRMYQSAILQLREEYRALSREVLALRVARDTLLATAQTSDEQLLALLEPFTDFHPAGVDDLMTFQDCRATYLQGVRDFARFVPVVYRKATGEAPSS